VRRLERQLGCLVLTGWRLLFGLLLENGLKKIKLILIIMSIAMVKATFAGSLIIVLIFLRRTENLSLLSCSLVGVLDVLTNFQ
jgi:hypothetical protein